MVALRRARLRQQVVQPHEADAVVTNKAVSQGVHRGLLQS